MAATQRKDGFAGEKQITVPEHILEKFTGNMLFNSSLYITHIGFYPQGTISFQGKRRRLR